MMAIPIQPRRVAWLHGLGERAVEARLRAARHRDRALVADQAAVDLENRRDRECGHKNQKRTMYEGSNEFITCLDCGKSWWD